MIRSDANLQISNEWGFMNDGIFGGLSPKSCEFNVAGDIIRVLNIIGHSSAYNHMLFNTGGLDFTRAEMANEEGCIYVYNDSFCNIVKPKALYYETFNDSRWNYFLLEADELAPILSTENDVWEEDLVEDTPGHYVASTYVQYGVYDYDSGQKLPAGYKHVNRFCKGKFLIVLKNGPYNGIPRTYDGRHAYCSNLEFKDYILNLINAYDFHRTMGIEERAILNSQAFNTNPFCDRLPDFEEPNEPQLPSAKEFVLDGFLNWNFKDIIDSVKDGVGKFRYYFKIRVDDRAENFLDIVESFWYLSDDGTIKKKKYGVESLLSGEILHLAD